MKRDEMKKLIPAVCVFVFVAFSFVIANTFGDTYAASCPSGYVDVSSTSSENIICCPNDADGYSSGECVADYNYDTGSCPTGFDENTVDGGNIYCSVEPVIIKSDFTIVFIAENGTIKGPDGEKNNSYSVEVSVGSIINVNDYVANVDGMKFKGWVGVGGNCETDRYSGDIYVDNDLELYACLEEDSSTDESTEFTVTLTADSDAIIDDGEKEYGTSYKITGTSFNYSTYSAYKSGSTFTGWGAKEGCTSGVDSGEISLTEDIELFACFVEDSSTDESTEFQITLNPGDGSWSNGSKDKKIATSVDGRVYLSSYTGDIVAPDGYVFNGWWSENEQKLLNSYADSKNENEELTASFVVEDSSTDDTPTTTTYTVNFYDEIGDEIDSITVNSGETISDFPSFKYPKLEHYWAIDGCDSGYEFNTNSAVVSELDLYQCYSEGFSVKFFNEYRDSFEEVEVFPQDIIIPSDEIPALNNGNDGFWSEYDTCKSEFDVADEVIVDDLELYACYTYNIYFYGLDENEEYERIGSSEFFNGFTLYDVENVPGEDDLLIEGKVFTHWSTSSNSCEEDYVLEPENMLPLSNDGVNLYACYTAGEAILVRFNDMNSNKITEMQVIKGISISDTVKNTGVKIPTAPTVEGYTFKYWSNGASCSRAYNFDNKVENPLTLTACYNKTSTNSGTTDDNINENPGTGSFMLYVVFLIGILSLGYTGYYVYKANRKEN